MEVQDALALMFTFGMFILALLTYLKKNRPPSRKGMRSTYKLISNFGLPPLTAVNRAGSRFAAGSFCLLVISYHYYTILSFALKKCKLINRDRVLLK